MGKVKTVLFFVTIAVSLALSNAKVPVSWLSGVKSFVAGGVGGVCSVIVGHPFDLAKVRMQTSASKNVTTMGVFQDIMADEGPRGLYRGVAAPILAVAPIFAISFWGFDMGSRMVRQIFNLGPSSPLSIPQLCIAGGFSALPTAIVMVPAERVKCILQTRKEFSGMGDCARGLVREGGLGALYKGTGLTLFRDIPSNIAYFGVYEIIKRQFITLTGVESAAQLSPLLVLAAGGIAGMAFWAAAIAPDTLKSRYQSAPEGTYTGMGDVYSKLMNEDGPGALFRGVGPAMIRSFPANAVTFLGAEVTKNVLSFLP